MARDLVWLQQKVAQEVSSPPRYLRRITGWRRRSSRDAIGWAVPASPQGPPIFCSSSAVSAAMRLCQKARRHERRDQENADDGK